MAFLQMSEIYATDIHDCLIVQQHLKAYAYNYGVVLACTMTLHDWHGSMIYYRLLLVQAPVFRNSTSNI